MKAKTIFIETHNGGWACFAHSDLYNEIVPVFGGTGTSIAACIEWKASNIVPA